MTSLLRKYFLLSLISTFMVTGVHTVTGQEIIMRKVDLPGSLSGGTIKTIFSGEDGFLWMGTSSGLVKYTGNQYRRYVADWMGDDQEITAIGQDKEGMIWVGFEKGNIAFLSDNTLLSFEPEEGTAAREITSLLFDSKGYLWWGTYGEGIYYYTGSRVYNINKDDGLLDNYIYDLEEDEEGKIWAATDAGVAVCSVDHEKKTVNSITKTDGLPDFIATSLFRDDEGTIWAGFDAHGFCYIDPHTYLVTIPPSAGDWTYGPVHDIFRHKGTLWVSTLNNGLIEVHPGTGNRPVVSSRIEYTQKHAGRITDDGMGNIWILADEGLFITTGIHFKLMRSVGSKPLKSLHSILIDRKGRLWFSSDEGLFVNDNNGNETKILSGKKINEAKVTSIAELPDGRICAASFGNGLYVIDPVRFSVENITSASGLINDHILSLEPDGNDIWLATLGGISRCRFNGEGKPAVFDFSQKENLGNSYIYTVYLDSKGNLWFGTDGKGLGKYDGHTMMLYDEQHGLDDDAIYSVTEDGSGNIWCAASSGNIYRFEGQKLIRMNDQGISAGPATYSLASTEPYVVAVRKGGVEIYDTRTGENVLLNDEIGLEEIDADLNSIFKDERGRIYMTTQEGILLFDHEDADFAMKPVTVIESVSVSSVPLKDGEDAHLKYFQNNISIDYSGLWFLAPGKVKYKVLLDGYEMESKNTFDDVAVYPNLPHGEYRFQVTSFLGDSPGTTSTDTFSFTIGKPFWIRAWFIIVVTILLITSIYIFIKYRENQLRTMEQRKKEKIEFEFQTLKNQVNPHFLFNSFSTLISLIEEAPAKAVNYTEKLSDFFRRILQAKESDLIPLSEEMELISDYMIILEERFGHNIRLETDLDEATRRSYILPMTLQMLIENVVKHNVISKEKPVMINITRENDKLKVRNTLNPKTSKIRSTGLGLENIKKRYLLVTRKEVEFSQTEEYFIVFIPIIE